MPSAHAQLAPAPADADGTRTATPPTIRRYAIGDIGWAIERHGRLYAEEFGWNGEFEAMVAGLFARFAETRDPAREDFWVAEIDGARVGCCFVVANADEPALAQLRCMLVEPAGRGRGVGRALLEHALDFARGAGYSGMMLWTNDTLHAARRLYESAGFRLVGEQPHHSYGVDLVGQVWRLAFRGDST